MRQAGRYLPEYRALKEKHAFVEMVRTPELAFEVTLQPLRRFQLDATIVFSDILVIPEAMGLGYSFREKGGIEMDFAVRDKAIAESLNPEGVAERLSHVGETLRKLRAKLGNEKAVLGFGGSPWTLACYAVEGGSADGFPCTLALARECPGILHDLLDRFTQASIDYFRMQAASGADAIQIFDSWGGLCPCECYEEWSLASIRSIVEALRDEIPIILYGKGVGGRLPDLADLEVAALSLDHSVDLANAKERLGEQVCVQGNLDPAVLETDPATTRKATRDLLESMRPHRGHIFNLGHGIRPQARIDCVEAMVDEVVAGDKDSPSE